jgi:hypothetical protein
MEEVRKNLARSRMDATTRERRDREKALEVLARSDKELKRLYREVLTLAVPRFADRLVRVLFMRVDRRVAAMDQGDRLIIARGNEVIVGLARIPPDRIIITRGGEVFVFDDGGMAILRGDEACVDFTQLPHVEALIVPEVWDLITMLIRLLDQHSRFAQFALPSAQDEIAANRKRKVGTDKGAKLSTKIGRASVERLMRVCLAKHEDATKHFGEWARVFGYTVRHLRNIWKDVQEAEKQQGNR